MEVERARDILRSLNLDDEGSFYGSPRGLSLGAGLLFRDVAFPFFDAAAGRFRVQSGPVCLLSHECDLDPGNDRFLNGMALICLLLPIEAVVESAQSANLPDEDLGGFLGHVARRRTPRCVYFPPLPYLLPNGGLLNLNLMASTSATELEGSKCIAALSAHAYRNVASALEQHLLRPKAEMLPFSDAPPNKGRTILG